MRKTSTMAALGGLAVICGTAGAGGLEPIATTRVAESLRFPIYATHAPGDFKRLYIIEKPGVIRILNLRTLQMNAQPFLDIDALVTGGTTSDDERGLLGLAFHPDFQKNGYFYVNFTGDAGATNVARFTAITRDQADSNTRQTLFTVAQPFSNHNGGWLDFGPNDGYLYIALGDGGLFGDPGNRAQDITDQFLGKMLRIDVNGNDRGNYGIPPSNPFVGVDGDDEIWAYGLRNPFRCSFDRENGDLFIGDVGQDAWEELDYQPADSAGGENYGWRCREGMHNYNFSGDCGVQSFVEPIHEYGRTLGRCIIAGYRYRGCAIPSLRGNYMFSDFTTSRIWRFDDPQNVNVFDETGQLGTSREGHAVNQVSSLGEDAAGEIYVVDQGSGTSGQIFRIVPVKPTVPAEDLNCDGKVSFGDLLQLLAAWGPCDGCREDLDFDDDVDFDDLLRVLAAWS